VHQGGGALPADSTSPATSPWPAYNRETLEILTRRNIHEVLEMVMEARWKFRAEPDIGAQLQTLIDVGLSYFLLGERPTCPAARRSV